MQFIPLSRGKFAMVDDEDFDWLCGHKWCVRKSKCKEYASRSHHTKSCSYVVRMHRKILGVYDANLQVDHINGDGLDNRKANLRICTNAQNAWNARKTRNNAVSQFKGVALNRKTGKWVASIGLHWQRICLGTYLYEKDAAVAYNEAAKRYFGEFAKLNPV